MGVWGRTGRQHSDEEGDGEGGDEEEEEETEVVVKEEGSNFGMLPGR